MNIAKLLFVFLTVAALVFVPSIATAQTSYTFDKTSGNWDTAGNWTPGGGPPGAGDTATIPSGKTCTIDTANQTALHVVVVGTLIIEGKTLSCLASGNTAPTLEVNGGNVIFEKPSSTVPKIVFDGVAFPADNFLISTTSSGKVRADGVSGHEGVIEANANWLLEVGSDVTIQGSIKIDCLILVNDGQFLVNHASDTMYVGETSNGLGSIGAATGIFEVSAGDMFIRRLKPASGFHGKIKVSGGTMTFTSHVAVAESPDAKVEVSGGTLLFESDFHSTRGLDFTGGTITVVDNETATFE